MDGLYEEWVKCNGNWLNSTIVLEAKRKEGTKFKNEERYISLKTIREKHGKLLAQSVAREKKELQATIGDKYENMPHWMENPDFKGVEDTLGGWSPRPLRLKLKPFSIKSLTQIANLYHKFKVVITLHTTAQDEELYLMFDGCSVTNKAQESKEYTFNTSTNLDGNMTAQVMSPGGLCM